MQDSAPRTSAAYVLFYQRRDTIQPIITSPPPASTTAGATEDATEIATEDATENATEDATETQPTENGTEVLSS